MSAAIGICTAIDPRRIAEGKNPFQLDSKEPDTSKVMDFLMGENRFASLKNNFPDKADALYAKEVEDVKARYLKYKKLAEDSIWKYPAYQIRKRLCQLSDTAVFCAQALTTLELGGYI